MIFSDFQKAISQLNDSRFLRVMGYGVALTVALLATVTMGVQWILPDTISLPWVGEIAWLSSLLSGFVLFAMIGMSVFLMVPVASIFTGFFLEQVADAVEDKHYPTLADVSPVPFMDMLIDSAKFLALLVVVNLCALVLYLIFTPIAPILFWAVNGMLLGREYFQLVAMRKLGRAGANAMRKKHRFQIFLAGFLMAVPLSVPFINLFIPVLGVATFTHLFHRINTAK
ncbi:membrane protein [Amylibacter ulvae]|uniref:Membrane protein n=1 Tax=Paramylibacter ulvae TaxID=1651968 RepID=A0ABQ3D2C4_9RHOB|nr:EI24 domain-containing protein [Amylibacter ulvae]GHA52403.1 membrane protein [Amylibacter ulvae]